MSDFKQAAIDAILEDLAFDSVKELRAYVSKNKQDDYFYGGILHAINAVQDLPSAQPVARDTNVLSNDTISRQAALYAIYGICNEPVAWLIRAAREIEKLPSAQPERKMGKWIYNSPVTMKCDQCGFVIKDWDWYRFKFCPNCDCDMRGEQE